MAATASTASTAARRPGPALLPGDPLPRLVLPEADGKGRFDFGHQSVAGDPLVLWLAASTPTPEALARFAGCAAALAGIEARAFLVVLQPPIDPVPEGVPVVLDPEGRLRAALGLAGAGVLVVEPRGRVGAVLEGEDFDGALARCRAWLDEGGAGKEPIVRRSGAPVLIVPGVLEPDLCAHLIAYWEGSGEKLHDLVASGKGAQDGRAATKRRTDVVIKDKPLFELLKARLLTRLVPEMRRAFGFEAASFEALRIGCYDAAAGGHFKRHRDNSTPYTAHRRFAMSLNLNTGAYTGGQVRFPEFGRELYEAEAGGAVVFSCSLLHEALPVTCGRRFAVFTFFADAVGAERERRMIREQEAAGKGGVALG